MYKKFCTEGTMNALGLLALRLAIGFIFTYQGLNKLMWGHAGAVGMFTKIGLFGGGEFWAYAIGILELVGGLMVMLGIFARYAAVWLSIIMLVAMLTVHRHQPITGSFLPIAILGGCLAVLGVGAGKWRLHQTECRCNACDTAGEAAEASGCGGGCCGNGSCKRDQLK